mgnify:CR=1 FL=1
MADIDINAEALELVVRQARQAVSLAVKYTATDVWGNIRKEAPVDHGRLAGSFDLSRESDMSYIVGTKVKYALAVHEGTPPHIIRPVRKKALFWRGARHPVKRVMHPGTQGNPYITRAINMTNQRIDKFVRRALREVGM